ncbi:MAG: hypothetical protein AAFN27_04085 [Pseudomonadota bacterium]
MPAYCRVYTDPGLLVTCIQGRVTIAEFREVYVELRSSPGFSPEFPEIVDFRSALSFEFDHTELARLAQRVTGQHAKMSFKTAILTTPGLSHGMARVYQSYAQLGDVESVQIFDTPAAAFAWVGLPDYRVAALEICPQ